MLVSTIKQASSIRGIVRDMMLMLSGSSRRKAAQGSAKTDPVQAVIKAMLALTPAQRKAVIKAMP